MLQLNRSAKKWVNECSGGNTTVHKIPSTIDELSDHSLKLPKHFRFFVAHFETKKFHEGETICG